MSDLARAIAELLQRRDPSVELLSIGPLAPDDGGGDETTKAVGYGAPLKLRIARGGRIEHLVLRTATPNDFGHDRRSDRAQQMLLAFDTFGRIPSHVRVLDVGAIAGDGRLISLAGAGELYLLTTWAPGAPYAEDLRRVAHTGEATPLDLARVEALARFLVQLHRKPGERAASYRRAVRDLVGHGEGIFGIVDSYPDGTPGAPPERLQAIERRAVEWRWRLRGRDARLRCTHGDFHPFNILFDEGAGFTLLDASRGCEGDPADDVAAMAINFPFFALARPAAWRGLGALWRRFFAAYLDGSGDGDLLSVIAPFLAWRGLVVVNPRFYPSVAGPDRERMLGFIERTLDAPRFDPALADALFTEGSRA
jgi:hypothetical protein